MVHFSMDELRRLAKIANDPSTGQAHRIGIADKLRQAARQRQVDPNAAPDELVEIMGMLVGMGEQL